MFHFDSHHFRGTLLFISLFLCIHVSTLKAARCEQGFFDEVQKRLNTTHCKKVLLGAGFGWKYNNNNQSSRTLEIVFGTKLDERRLEWMAWGLNPGPEARMVGTRALIGIKNPNSLLTIDTYDITKDTRRGCKLQPSRIDLNIVKYEFVYKDPYYMIHAQIVLPPKEYKENMTNIVWQVGNLGYDGQPKMHARTLKNVDSTQTMNLVTGKEKTLGTHYRLRLRITHGILNMVGWGTFLPIGVIIARYFREHPIKCSKMWYRLHVSCQIAGWCLGTAGWIMGLWLGNASKYYAFRIHRTLGIFIFIFSTLQMLALRLKPDKIDAFRLYWNMYHHFLGYALLATIIVNIFRGIRILSFGYYYWIRAYIGILISLGCIVLVLEIYTWRKFIKNNNETSNQQPRGPTNGNEHHNQTNNPQHMSTSTSKKINTT